MFRVFTILLSLTIVFISCSTETQFKGKFGFSPETVTPGDEITIQYNPDSTILAGSDKIDCIAYLFNNELINTIDVQLHSEENILTGQIKTDENTLGVLVKFKTDDLLDNNDKKGYII